MPVVTMPPKTNRAPSFCYFEVLFNNGLKDYIALCKLWTAHVQCKTVDFKCHQTFTSKFLFVFLICDVVHKNFVDVDTIHLVT